MGANRIAWTASRGSYETEFPDHDVRLKAVDRLIGLVALGSQHGGGGGDRVLTREEWESRLRAYAGLSPERPN